MSYLFSFWTRKYFSVLHAAQHSERSDAEWGCVSLYRGFPKLTLELLQKQAESKINEPLSSAKLSQWKVMEAHAAQSEA